MQKAIRLNNAAERLGVKTATLRDWFLKRKNLDFVKVGLFENCRIGANQKSRLFSGFNTVDRSFENTFSFHAQIVSRFEPVQMHVEEQPRRRLEFMQALPDKHSIRAEVNVLFAIKDLADQPPQIGIDEGLATTNRNDRRAALVESVQALFHRQLFADGVRVFANAATPCAGEIAGVQGLQHHDKRKLFGTSQPLAGDIAGHACGKSPGESQESLPGR